MSLSEILDNLGTQALCSASNLRQHHQAEYIWPDVAEKREKEGREWKKIACEGTDLEKKVAYHKYLHGAPGAGVLSARFM
jgi:hypothetical protein